jgi:small-conductance mechanosensitive channel
MSDKHKHLEFIQGAVNRMASNLFFFKGWTVTLIAALFALAAKDSNQHFLVLGGFPLLIFWILDGYFLAQERRFRALFDHVRQKKDADIDFSMDTNPFKNEPRNTVFGAMFSSTLFVYYGVIILMMISFSVLL